MKISKVQKNSFGMRITDNFQFQLLQHFWTKRTSAAELREAILKMKNCVDDSVELTFKDFTLDKPCEVWIRKQYKELKKVFLQYGKIKERVAKRGRPKKHPDSHVYDVLSPTKAAEIISQAAVKYVRKTS